MTEQQQQHEDPSCAVDLSASALPEDKKEVDQEEVLTTTIESSTAEPSTTEASTTEVTAEVTADEAKSEPQSGFDGFGFSEALLKTLADKGYSDPSPIQKAAFPELMLGRDLVGQAQTGTGKTAAFALPLLERLESGQKTPQVLVLAPTRELAMQVADSFKAYAAGHPHLKVLAVYGGTDFRSQISTLRRGVDVVVGTPGRVMDHMRQGTLDTSGLTSLVLDEADEMLRMGFIDDVEWILEQLPKNDRWFCSRQRCLPRFVACQSVISTIQLKSRSKPKIKTES
jgi:ATP-dependent RNA helicase DeaD